MELAKLTLVNKHIFTVCIIVRLDLGQSRIGKLDTYLTNPGQNYPIILSHMGYLIKLIKIDVKFWAT